MDNCPHCWAQTELFDEGHVWCPECGWPNAEEHQAALARKCDTQSRDRNADVINSLKRQVQAKDRQLKKIRSELSYHFHCPYSRMDEHTRLTVKNLLRELGEGRLIVRGS